MSAAARGRWADLEVRAKLCEARRAQHAAMGHSPGPRASIRMPRREPDDEPQPFAEYATVFQLTSLIASLESLTFACAMAFGADVREARVIAESNPNALEVWNRLTTQARARKQFKKAKMQ